MIMWQMSPSCFIYGAQLRTDGFIVYSIIHRDNALHTLNRKDFYKVMLLSGSGTINYGDRSVKINGSVLMITGPGAICSWSLSPTLLPSYACVMAHEFLDRHCFNWVNKCNLFSSENPRVYNLSADQSLFLGLLFQKMINAQQSSYPLKGELIQDQICVLLHTALRLEPSEKYVDSTAKLIHTNRPVELVEMMFPPEAQMLHLN